MCWFGKQKDRKLAQEDIKCKKFITKNVDNNQYFAFFHKEHLYQLGKTYYTPLQSKLERERWISIQRGLHCYAPYVEITGIPHKAYTVKYNASIVTYSTNIMAISTTRDIPVLVECTIPKGSEYYENQYGEIVAERLIINREIDEGI